MGPNLAGILENYWRRKRIAPKVGKYLGTVFGIRRGVTQGDPPSPMVYSIVVDTVVYGVLEELYSMQEVQHGMGWEAGARNIVFYADDRRISGWDHKWVQDTLTITIAMFRRMGIDTNLEKPRRWCAPPHSSGGTGGSWHIRDGRQYKGQPSGSG